MAGQNRWRHPTAPGRVMVGGGGEWSQDFAQPGDESLPEMPKEVLWAISNAVGDRESMGGPMRVEQPALPDRWEPPSFAPEAKSVDVVAAQPVIQGRTPAARIDARPVPVLSPEEREAKAAEMVASLNRPGEGQAAAVMGRPPGVMGLAAQAAASTAQGVAGGRGGAPAPSGDPQMDRAKLLSAASGVEARLSSAADPLKAALLGRRDDGAGRREAIANAERTDPVAGLTAERKVQAELQMQRDRLNPNSEHSRRIRDLMAGGDPVKVKAMEGASAADLEKFAPLLVKQIEAQMAREAREGAREDQQAFQAGQNALARQQSAANAQTIAGLGVAREDRAESRAIAREDRGEQRKKQAQTVEIEERFRGADKSLEEMEKLIGENGTWEAFGPHNTTLESLITGFATDMAKLRDPTSVAREAEVALERKALGDPNRFGIRNSTALQIIKDARRRLADRRAEAYRVRGLDSPGARPAATTPAAAPEQDAAAVEWAKANPSDPRAAEILRLNGVQ